MKESEDVGTVATVTRTEVTDYTLILHTLQSGKTCPSVSPFVLKLETYLRMAGIKYTIDTSKPFGGKGKTPWITFNGKTVDDSTLIIDFLNKTFNKDLWGKASKEQKAVSQAMRIMLEDHFLLELAVWRWITGVNTIDEILAISGIRLWMMKMIFPRRVKNKLAATGILLFTEEERMQILKKDLIAIADYLGDKDFFLGNEPTEIDSAIFGVMAQYVYCSPGSPYEKIINEEYPKIKEYCERIRIKFWEDWESLLTR